MDTKTILNDVARKMEAIMERVHCPIDGKTRDMMEIAYYEGIQDALKQKEGK